MKGACVGHDRNRGGTDFLRKNTVHDQATYWQPWKTGDLRETGRTAGARLTEEAAGKLQQTGASTSPLAITGKVDGPRWFEAAKQNNRLTKKNGLPWRKEPSKGPRGARWEKEWEGDSLAEGGFAAEKKKKLGGFLQGTSECRRFFPGRGPPNPRGGAELRRRPIGAAGVPRPNAQDLGVVWILKGGAAGPVWRGNWEAGKPFPVQQLAFRAGGDAFEFCQTAH